jgi:hypothetical protein
MTPDPLLAKYRMAGWPDPIAEGLATWEGERLVDTIEAREQAARSRHLRTEADRRPSGRRPRTDRSERHPLLIQHPGRSAMPKQLAGSNTASHVLVLPTDNPTVTARLALKLNEYQRRYDPNRAPEQQMGTLCKTAVLLRLLSEQRVVTWDLCRELRATYGSGFDPDAFSNACRVIADYYTTGGERNRGGTGLPPLPASTNTPPSPA